MKDKKWTAEMLVIELLEEAELLERNDYSDFTNCLSCRWIELCSNLSEYKPGLCTQMKQVCEQLKIKI